jgi:hypothetical protein
LSQTGSYTATQQGVYQVVASLGSQFSDTAIVMVANQGPSLTKILVSPKPFTIQAAGVQQFRVSGIWSDGITGQPVVAWVSTGGSITAGGLYTAGSVAGIYRVIAIQQGGTLADTASVTIQPPRVIALSVKPKTANIGPGGQTQFTASAAWSNGSTTVPMLSWSSTGGNISSGGTYAAGSVPGTYRVVVAGGGVERQCFSHCGISHGAGFPRAQSSVDPAGHRGVSSVLGERAVVRWLNHGSAADLVGDRRDNQFLWAL